MKNSYITNLWSLYGESGTLARPSIQLEDVFVTNYQGSAGGPNPMWGVEKFTSYSNYRNWLTVVGGNFVNPPVTGTVYRNLAAVGGISHDTWVYVPITLNPTAGAAATAFFRVGNASGVGANPIIDQVSLPATSLVGQIAMLRAKVMVGQYLEIDVVNAVIGTAVVFPAGP
jgi:hypothetical protein